MKLKALVLLTLLAIFASARNYSVNASESTLADQIQFSLNHVTSDNGILMPKLGPIFGLNITYDSIMQGKNNHDIFQLKRLAEIDGYTSSTMDSLVSSALDSQTMSLHWPDFQVGYGYAMSVYDKFIVNCYRWAQQHGQASKWDKNAAYQEFLMPWHNLSNFLWFNPGDGVRDFGDRYYDENAQVLTIFLKFYQSGVSDAMGPALQMWDHLLTNHWSGSYFPYRGTSGQVECEAGNFAESIGELYVATGRNLSNFPDYLLKDLDYKFLSDGDWSGKLWRNYAVQHAESNPELRLENTLAAWAALHSYYIMMDSTMRANFVKLLTEFPTAWKGLVDYSSLYSNGQFGWRSGASPSGSATLAGILVLLLGGIVPDTGSLALPVMDESYQDIGSEFPISHLRFDYESRTIRIPVWAGNIKFIFGSGVASHNFTTDGIYEVHFSADWNTVDSSSLVSPLMSDQFSYLMSPVAPLGINILSPQNTTYAITPVPLTFTVNGSVSWMGYSLDDQLNVTIGSNTTLAGLSVGQHSVIVYANDTSGSMGASEAVDFTIVHSIIVPDDYPTIQEAINNANDGDLVFVKNGTYYESVAVNKTVSLVGENRKSTIIDANRTAIVFNVTSNNVKISDFTIRNGDYGIALSGANDTIFANDISNNAYSGIQVEAPWGECRVFHNNFVNNSDSAQISLSHNATWDDDYPSGGNYWSDYNCTDLYQGPYQNETGSDGIGDSPYIIDADNKDNYPLMKAFLWSEHDIGITYIGRVYSFDLVVPLKTVVGLHFSLNISTFVMNYGNQSETFNVQIYTNDTLVGTFANVTLASRQSAILNLRWNTTGFAYGNYTVRAVADNLSGETDISDNAYTDGIVYVGILGDVNGDDKVDMRDIGYVARRFGTDAQNPLWDPNADLNDDEKIDMLDTGNAARHFTEHL